MAFLDYGTLERRREMCRRRGAVNRRAAPDVYLGVRAIVSREDGVALAAEDAPDAIEYAVEMRRFDEAATLAAALETGEATAGAPHGRRAPHRRLPRGVPGGRDVRRRGGGEALHRRRLRHAVDAAAATTPPGPATWSRRERFAAGFLGARWGELDGRARDGHARDGHGDLRAEHVLLGAEPALVDAIEFDPGLRRIDVGLDLGVPRHGAPRGRAARPRRRARRGLPSRRGRPRRRSPARLLRRLPRPGPREGGPHPCGAASGRGGGCDGRDRSRTSAAGPEHPVAVGGARSCGDRPRGRDRLRQEYARAGARRTLAPAAPQLRRDPQAARGRRADRPGSGVRVQPRDERVHVPRARTARRRDRRNGDRRRDVPSPPASRRVPGAAGECRRPCRVRGVPGSGRRAGAAGASSRPAGGQHLRRDARGSAPPARRPRPVRRGPARPTRDRAIRPARRSARGRCRGCDRLRGELRSPSTALSRCRPGRSRLPSSRPLRPRGGIRVEDHRRRRRIGSLRRRARARLEPRPPHGRGDRARARLPIRRLRRPPRRFIAPPPPARGRAADARPGARSTPTRASGSRRARSPTPRPRGRCTRWPSASAQRWS